MSKVEDVDLKAILSKKDLSLHIEYLSCVNDILNDGNILALKLCRHHLVTSRFQHSLNVSYYNFIVCKRLHLNAKAAARAGLLHDFYFYTKQTKPIQGSHAIIHPTIALKNALTVFDLSGIETDMITTHMWPLAKHMPHYKETVVISMIDKFCALVEILTGSLNIGKQKIKSLKKHIAYNKIE